MARRPTLTGRNISAVRSHNLRAVLHALRRHEHISRVGIAHLTGLSTAAVTNLIGELIKEGVVTDEGLEQTQHPSGVGRPRRALRLVPEARHAVGVHIGVGSLRVTMADLCGRPVYYRSLALPGDRSPQAVLREIVSLVGDALDESGVSLSHIVGIGVGASGLVDPQTGVNMIAPNLGWQDVPLLDWLGERLAFPICVDNNVRAMALAEAMFGAGQDARVLAFVYARIGVGAGLVVDGQLYRGSGGGAGEIGHTTIITGEAYPCRCGNSGCLEALVAEPTIVRLAQELARHDRKGLLAQHLGDGQGSALERVFSAARAGDLPTCIMLRERARYMGIALANLVNVFNPELIVLGGIFEQGQDLLLPTSESVMRQRAFGHLGQQVKLRPTTFGRQAGAIGAAALALNAFFYQQNETRSSNQNLLKAVA